MDDFNTYARSLGETAQAAARRLAGTRDAKKSDALRRMAAGFRSAAEQLLAANQIDVAAAESARLDPPIIERLKLDATRIEAMAAGVERIAAQVDPVGQTIEASNRPSGLRVERRRVPIGVILFFYESRPNVTADAAALCIKSGNAVILRGGKEAHHTNQAIAAVVAHALAQADLPAGAVQVVETTDRALVPHLLRLSEFIDLIIPRGGKSLISAVMRDATIPVLKHLDGNCHLYIDRHVQGMEQKAIDVCVNAKTSYPGGAVCNAVEHILIHRDAARLMRPLYDALKSQQVEVRGSDTARAIVPELIVATAADWDTEYLAFTVAIDVVDSIAAAIAHINRHGSKHTDGILSTNLAACEQFANEVDSASIMINASTRLADGGEYGLGAEIGISTSKLHARGPMGAADLTTYKWIVTGSGHTR